MRNTYYLLLIIARNKFRTTNKTNGKTRLKPNPENKFVMNPVILGFENNEEYQNHKQPEQYRKRNSDQLAEKIYQVQRIVRESVSRGRCDNEVHNYFLLGI